MTTTKRPAKPTFVLTLVAEPRGDDADGMRRLRAVLKLLLRTFGFRCKRVEYPADEQDQEASRG